MVEANDVPSGVKRKREEEDYDLLEWMVVLHYVSAAHISY
jgi:hypothetical protein